MRQYYSFKQLDDSEKATFLQIITNTILVVLTFWLGLSVTFFITDNSKKSSEMLTNMEYVDKFLPYQETIGRLMKFDGLSYDLSVVIKSKKEQKDIIKQSESVLQQYCSDSLHRQMIINNCDELADIFSYIKYFVPQNGREEFLENLKRAYLATQLMKYCSYPDFDIIAEMNSVRSLLVCDTVLPITEKDIIEMGGAIVQKADLSVYYLFVEAYRRLLSLNLAFMDTFGPSDKYGFWNNTQLKYSLLLLILSLVIIGIIAKIVMRKTLAKHDSVSRTKFSQSEIERKHLEIEVEQSKAELKTLNFVYQELSDKYDDLYDRFMSSLEEIKQLREQSNH